MRIPLVEPYAESAPEEVIYLPKDMYDRDPVLITNDKELATFIKSVEKMVRGSLEYREYISYLVNAQEMNICSAFNAIGKELGKKFRIEIHHEPFTLYDISYIVYLNFINRGKKIDVFDISEQVLDIHYRGMVGLLPLSKTVHELVHVGRVFLPLQYLDDGFMKFFDLYHEEIEQCSLKEPLEKKIALSKMFNFKSNSVLQKKYIYINNEGYDNIPQVAA